MEAAFRRYIAAHALLPVGANVVVAVSGGLDSMVLLHLLQSCDVSLTLAHVNYRLRGEAADADAALVESYARLHHLPVQIRVADWEGAPKNLQKVARDLRYAFFAEVAQGAKADRVAVAHHADDQAETVLLNLFRGAGLEGLAGMAPSRPLTRASPIPLIRPLLFAKREEIQDYAERHQLQWREDASNNEVYYRRNALRHIILPAVSAQFGPAALGHVVAAASRVRAYLNAIQPELEDAFASCATDMPQGGQLKLAAWQVFPAVIRDRMVIEALQRWLPTISVTAETAARVRGLCHAQPGRRIQMNGGTVWRGREALLFVATGGVLEQEEQALSPGETILIPGGLLSASLEPRPESLAQSGPDVAYLDADTVQWPLTVRTWQRGDRFQPYGMAHRKKVSDLLTDAKVPVHARQSVQVVTSEGEVVWVVRHRLAHPVRVTPETKHVAVLRVLTSPSEE